MLKKILFILFISGSVIFSAVPKWYLNPITSGYKNSEIIVAVGHSTEDYSDAIKKGLVDLSNQIKTDVKSRSVLANQSVKSGSKESISSSYTSISKLSTDLKIEGYKIINKEKIDNKFYVKIILNKKEYGTKLLSEILELDGKINELVEMSSKYLSDGDLENSLNSLSKTKNIFSTIRQKVDFLNLISSTPKNSYTTFSSSDIMKKMIKIIKDTKIIILGKHKIIVNTGENINLKVNIVNGNINLKNMRVSFFEEGNFIPISIVQTDKNGIANLTFVAKYHPDTYKNISINLVPEINNKSIKNLLSKTEKIFNYKTFSSELNPISLSISSFDLSVEEQNNLENELSTYLVKSGFKIVKDSKIVLNVVVSKEKLQSISTRFNRVMLELNYKLMSEDLVLYSYSSKSLGVGKKDSEALSKAIKYIKIKDKDLTNIIKKLR